MKPADTSRRALSLKAFCQAYALSRSQAYREMGRGRLKSVKLGYRTIIPVEEAEAWFSRLPQRRFAQNP